MQGKSRHPPPKPKRPSVENLLGFQILQLARIFWELEKLNQKESHEMAAIDDIRTNVAVLRQSDTDIKAGIADLATRIGNNPNEAELATIATELAALGTAGAENKAAIDALDPDVPGGPINPDTELPG